MPPELYRASIRAELSEHRAAGSDLNPRFLNTCSTSPMTLCLLSLIALHGGKCGSRPHFLIHPPAWTAPEPSVRLASQCREKTCLLRYRREKERVVIDAEEERTTNVTIDHLDYSFWSRTFPPAELKDSLSTPIVFCTGPAT
jgi:hypothetical protein